MILLTGLCPFDQRSVNGAETVARALHGAQIGGARVETRLTNVVWTDVDRFCSGVLATTRARLVLSLGEADRPWPTFESQALARCEGPDVSGIAATGALDGFETTQSRLKCSEAWFDELDATPQNSTDAGAYLCNYLLMRGLHACTQPFGFLHVPVQNNIPDDVFTKRYAPVVRTLIERNLAAL